VLRCLIALAKHINVARPRVISGEILWRCAAPSDKGESVTRIAVAVLALLLLVTPIASAQSAPSGTSEAGRFTVGAEALLWWFKGNPTPTLVTGGLFTDPEERIFLGGKDVDTNPNPGFRLNVGYGLTDQWGLDSSFFYIPTRTVRGSVSSSGKPGSLLLLIPVIDAVTGLEDPQAISFPGIYSGGARLEISNDLLGADLNATMRVASGRNWRVEALGGVRYLRLHETLLFTTDSPNVAPFPADVYTTTDRFEVTNNFFGVQLGARAKADWGSLFLNGVVKVGLGVMRQTLDISGTLLTNDFNDFGVPISYPAGGYFATPTNVGEKTRNQFGVVPEVGLNLGYRLTPWMSVVAGYTFLYANTVLRAPNQLVRTVNYSSFEAPPTRPTGPQEPSFKFKSSDFWAQGLNVGMVFRF
jgi:hypothetical protein